jgi:FkbM family methyltransferase
MKIIYKIIYTPFINLILRSLNKTFSFAFPKIKIPPSGVISLKLKDGDKIKFCTNQTDPVGQNIFWKGVYGYEYVDIFEDIISHCKGFLDIGSNAGLYSMIAAKKSKDIRVVAFDPTNASAHYFRNNIAVNGFESNINFFQLAISDVKGEISFYEVRNKKYPFLKHNLGGAASAVNKPKEYKEIKVPSTPLEDCLKENNLEDLQIDFVKIDAEGVEPQIIQGMDSVIKTHKPIIVCEILFNDIEKELENEFSKYDYLFFGHKGKKLIQLDSIIRKEDDGIRNCFFVPREKVDMMNDYI